MQGFDKRLSLAATWLRGVGIALHIEASLADASWRRYFRIRTDWDRFMLMDSPSDVEPLEPFIDIANRLRSLNSKRFKIPSIHYLQPEFGFALLQDLGKQQLLDASENHSNRLILAIDALIDLQQADVTNLAVFDAATIHSELQLFRDWYLPLHRITFSNKQQQHWQQLQQQLAEAFAEQPQVFVHKDYHCRNLLLRTKADHPIGLLDFQDGLAGPITYDLASLLKDAYQVMSTRQIDALMYYYYEHAALAQQLAYAKFTSYFHLTALQRHLKILGIFVRLSQRDGKHNYLQYLTTVEDYILQFSQQQAQLNFLSDCLLQARRQRLNA